MIENVLDQNGQTVLDVVNLEGFLPEVSGKHNLGQLVDQLNDLGLVGLVEYIDPVNVLLPVVVL